MNRRVFVANEWIWVLANYGRLCEPTTHRDLSVALFCQPTRSMHTRTHCGGGEGESSAHMYTIIYYNSCLLLVFSCVLSCVSVKLFVTFFEKKNDKNFTSNAKYIYHLCLDLKTVQLHMLWYDVRYPFSLFTPTTFPSPKAWISSWTSLEYGSCFCASASVSVCMHGSVFKLWMSWAAHDCVPGIILNFIRYPVCVCARIITVLYILLWNAKLLRWFIKRRIISILHLFYVIIADFVHNQW